MKDVIDFLKWAGGGMVIVVMCWVFLFGTKRGMEWVDEARIKREQSMRATTVEITTQRFPVREWTPTMTMVVTQALELGCTVMISADPSGGIVFDVKKERTQ